MKTLFSFIKSIYDYEELFNLPNINTFEGINFLDSYSQKEYESRILHNLF